jgi:hypothetical protein
MQSLMICMCYMYSASLLLELPGLLYECCSSSNMTVQKNLGASLLETFTVDQIEMHLRSTAGDMERTPLPKGHQSQGPPEDQCHICKAQHILRFEPPPKSCVSCGNRIKRNQTYYQHSNPDAIWCLVCFNSAGDNLYVENLAICKTDVADKKKRNEQLVDEEWVNCDNPNCSIWVHIICGLFNKVRMAPVAALTPFKLYALKLHTLPAGRQARSSSVGVECMTIPSVSTFQERP